MPADSPAPPLDVAVTVISHGHRELLRNCLDALSAPATLSYKTWVLDNASTDGSREMVQTDFPAVHLLASDRRRGFSANQNLLFEACRGHARHVLLLNDDARITPDQVATLVHDLDADPAIGAVAPELVNPDGSFQTAGEALPGSLYQVTRLLGLGRLVPARLRRAAGRGAGASIYETGYVAAACVLIRGEALAAVGGFDERFEMYSEDVDWCRRAHLAGWRVCVDPAVRVLHHRRQSWSPATAIERERSMVRYLRKAGRPPLELAVVRGALLLRHVPAWLAARLAGRRSATQTHAAMISVAFHE